MNRIIVFSSVHYVFVAERLCNELEVAYQIINIPKKLSSDCGMCIVVSHDEEAKVKSKLDEIGVKYKIFQK